MKSRFDFTPDYRESAQLSHFGRSLWFEVPTCFPKVSRREHMTQWALLSQPRDF